MAEFEMDNENAGGQPPQALVPVSTGGQQRSGSLLDDEFLGDLKMQAQEYGQKLQDAASRAKDFAGEKFAQANERLKEMQGKDPQELVEDAKEYARQKPGQAILISAAVGLVLGFLLKGRR